jgi:hypothetical protein
MRHLAPGLILTAGCFSSPLTTDGGATNDATGSDPADAPAAAAGTPEVAFITYRNALGGHELHVVAADGRNAYLWGNHDYPYTGNTIDMDASDGAQRIAVGGGQGNINNKVLFFDYQGNKKWETGANGNAQGTRFYKGYFAQPIVAVGYHDNTFDVQPTGSQTATGVGFYARDLTGKALAWHPQFPDGGGASPFRGGALNVWHSYADEANRRLFVMGEFESAQKTDGSASGVPVSRIAVYQQAASGAMPQVPTATVRLGASWFVSSSATKHAGNPWTMTQTSSFYYVGGHSFDTAATKAGARFHVSSLVRVRISDLDLDATWRPAVTPVTTDSTTCAVVRELARYGGEILVAGRFTGFQGQPRANLAAFDAASGAITGRFADLHVTGGEVLSIAVDGDRAYIAGTFTSVTDAHGAHARAQLACIDLTTGLVTAWNPSPGVEVRRVRVLHVLAT